MFAEVLILAGKRSLSTEAEDALRRLEELVARATKDD